MRPEKYLGWIILLILLAIFHLYIYTKNIGINYDIESLKDTFNELYSENHYLASEISSLSRLSRIEELAKNKLGMEYPVQISYLVASSETISKTGQ